MKSIPQYSFHKTKYGDELLIDVVELSYIKNFVAEHPVHSLTYYDITLISEGSGFFRIDDQEYIVAPGDVIFSVPGVVREWDKDHIMNGCALIFEKEFLLAFFNDPDFMQHLLYFRSGASSKLSLDNETRTRIFGLTENIKNEINAYQIKDKHILRALLYEALMLLNRAYKNGYGFRDTKPYPANRYINKFEILVNENFRNNRSIQHYADQLCITPNYLNEVIKNATGISAKQHIQNKIILEAKRMLAYTNLPVSGIADDLGFDDPSYFIRFFRKQTGHSPLQYRKVTGL